MSKNISALKIAENLGMVPQEEGGLVMENHYPNERPERAQSGQAYYFFKPNVPTEFHSIDCDEYWIFNAGDDLEVWTIDDKGNSTVRMLGMTEGAELCLYFKKGVIFAGKPTVKDSEGTMTTVITVPRYSNDGLRIFSKKEILKLCPAAESFFA